MKASRFVSITIAAAAVIVGSGVDAQNAAVEKLMGQALHQEEVEGNLGAALATYTAVTSDPQTPRAVAARALLRAADLYERLGKAADARIQYERLVRDYSDQADAARQATARLAALSGPEGSRDTHVVARQIWVGDGVDVQARPTRDGRYLVYSDWMSTNTGNVAVRDLATRQDRRLTHFTAADGYVYEPVASPDGKQVAYIFYGEGRTSIRTIGFDGSNDRVLVDMRGSAAYYPHWSPDGRRLALSVIDFAGDRTWHIAVIDVRDGSVARLKSTGWQGPELGGFSPDGRFLLYAIPNSSSATGSGIFALAVDGSGRETALVSGPANDVSPVWTPGGDRIVFLSDRSGKQDLWAIGVSDGEPRGEPTLLRANVGEIFNLGFARDGSYFYSTPNRQNDIYVAEMDPATLQLTSRPKRLSDRFVGSNAAGAWSPDGRSIAFLRGADRRATSIVIHSVADATERTLPIKLNDGIAAGPIWMPDSRSLLVRDSDYANQRFTLWQVDVESGQQSVLLEGEISSIHPQVQVSRDGRILFFTRRERATPEQNLLKLMKRDLASGEETELYRAESGGIGFFGLALSPDGDRLAFSANVASREEPRHVIVVPTSGGSPRILYRGDYTHPTPFGGVWTPDGKHILAVAEDTKSLFRVWAFPADGGEPRKLDIVHQWIGRLDLSPDGRQIVFVGRQRNAEVWTIKNLIPDARPDTRSAR